MSFYVKFHRSHPLAAVAAPLPCSGIVNQHHCIASNQNAYKEVYVRARCYMHIHTNQKPTICTDNANAIPGTFSKQNEVAVF